MSVSNLIKAFHMIPDTPAEVKSPAGQFGYSCVIKTAKVELESSAFDFEFNIPFDDDLEANEADFTFYNLSDDTLNKFKSGNEMTCTAGYKGDRGLIFKGYITTVKTTYEENGDKKTSVTAADDSEERTVDNQTFAKGSKASYILKTLLGKWGLPIKAFNPARDHTYDSEVTVDGDLSKSIKTYADVCGISVYVCKGQIYARKLSEGDNINLTISPDTGLVGSPEPFEEANTAADYEDKVNGYKITMLLQHRVTTGSIVKLSSRQYKGTFRVRSGTHKYNPDTATTQIEVI